MFGWIAACIAVRIVAASFEDYKRLLLWSIVLIGFILAGFLVVSWVKRRLAEPDAPASAGFSLADLRDLHRKGQISTEEFDRARAKIVATLKSADDQKNKVPPTKHSPPTPD